MERRSGGRGGICSEIEYFHELQTKKQTDEAVHCLRRICDIKGFIIDRSKYCELYGKVAEKPMEVNDSAEKETLVRISLSDRTAEVKMFMVIQVDINVNSFKEMIHKYYGFPSPEQIFLLNRERKPDDFPLNHETLRPAKNSEGFYDVHVYLKDALLRKRRLEGQQFDTEKVVRGMVPKDPQRRQSNRRMPEDRTDSPQPRPRTAHEMPKQDRASRGQRDSPSRNRRRDNASYSTLDRSVEEQRRAVQEQRNRALQEEQQREQRSRRSSSRHSTSRHDAAIAQQIQMEEWEAESPQPERQREFKDVKPTQGSGDTWICSLCTFENQGWRPGCEQCSTEKP